MIFTQALRTSALDAIKEAIQEEVELIHTFRSAPTTIKNYAAAAELIANAIFDEEVDQPVEEAIMEWADPQVIKEARLAEMDQALKIMEDDVKGDNPEINLDTVWYDLVQAVALDQERDAITAEWIRTKLG